jgi:hypothetical protein
MERSYSLGEFARQNNLGVTTVRGEIKAGRLVARKVGRRTIIAAEDAKAWQEQLPKVQPRVRVASSRCRSPDTRNRVDDQIVIRAPKLPTSAPARSGSQTLTPLATAFATSAKKESRMHVS